MGWGDAACRTWFWVRLGAPLGRRLGGLLPRHLLLDIGLGVRPARLLFPRPIREGLAAILGGFLIARLRIALPLNPLLVDALQQLIGELQIITRIVQISIQPQAVAVVFDGRTGFGPRVLEGLHGVQRLPVLDHP